MSQSEELLLGTFSHQNISVHAWNFNTGNVERTYKNGGTSVTDSLCVLANDYLLTADQDKPMLHIWPVNNQEQIKNIQFIMPEVVNCIDVDSSNTFLVAGIGLKLYIWHINSGKLLNIIQRHYQPISRVKFSSDSAYIVVTGKDGILIVYRLGDIVSLSHSSMSQENIGECKPLYKREHHTTPITDICIGNFGSNSRIATVSEDKLCNIYTLHSGELLKSLVFNEIPTTVLLDSTSWNVYVGDTKGLIKRVSLRSPPRTLQLHVDSIKDDFIGHQNKIICLDLNLDNSILASSAEDSHIIIWETKHNRQLKIIECSGIVANLKFVLKFANFQVQTLKSNIALNPFQRNIDNNLENFVVYGTPNQIMFETKDDDDDEGNESRDNETLDDPQSEINKLKNINKQIYDASIRMAKHYNVIN